MIDYSDTTAYELTKDKTMSAIIYTDKCDNRYTLLVKKDKPDEKKIEVWFNYTLNKVKIKGCL